MSKPPPVPYTKETLAELQARYPRCLEFVYDAEAIRDHGSIRPGEVAANVFDFSDGLRLLVSRERLPGGVIALHVSASFQDECEIADSFRLQLQLAGDPGRQAMLAEKWAATIPARFAELSGDQRPITLVGWVNLIPHFVRDPE